MGRVHDQRPGRRPAGGLDPLSRKILFLRAGRHHRQPWETLCADYRERIGRTFDIEDRLIKAGSGEGVARRRAEGKALREQIPDPSWVIALDPRGRSMSSEKWSAEMMRLKDEWPHPLVFLIGSDLGLDPSLLQDARLRLSFGPMVFGHELARLVLYEQVYRAIAMTRGIKYHRASF